MAWLNILKRILILDHPIHCPFVKIITPTRMEDGATFCLEVSVDITEMIKREPHLCTSGVAIWDRVEQLISNVEIAYGQMRVGDAYTHPKYITINSVRPNHGMV